MVRLRSGVSISTASPPTQAEGRTKTKAHTETYRANSVPLEVDSTKLELGSTSRRPRRSRRATGSLSRVEVFITSRPEQSFIAPRVHASENDTTDLLLSRVQDISPTSSMVDSHTHKQVGAAVALALPENVDSPGIVGSALKRKRLSPFAVSNLSRVNSKAKPSILSLGGVYQKERRPILGSSSGSSTIGKRGRARSNTGLLTPAASASSAEPNALSEHDDDVDVMSRPSKDTGKQRALDASSPTASDSGGEYGRAPKKARAISPGYVTSDFYEEHPFVEQFVEEEASGFQMIDFLEVLPSPWTSVHDPQSNNSMYVPQCFAAVIANMQIAFEAENKARQAAERALTDELQKSSQYERRIAELEAERSALLTQMYQLRSSPPDDPMLREEWIQAITEEIAGKAMDRTKALLDEALFRTVMKDQTIPDVDTNAGEGFPDVLGFLSTAGLRMAMQGVNHGMEGASGLRQSAGSTPSPERSNNKGKGRMADHESDGIMGLLVSTQEA